MEAKRLEPPLDRVGDAERLVKARFASGRNDPGVQRLDHSATRAATEKSKDHREPPGGARLVKIIASGYGIRPAWRKAAGAAPLLGRAFMKRPHRKLPAQLAGAALLGLAAAACVGGEEFQRGYILDENLVSQVKPGMSGEQVLQTLGTPSTVSTVGNKSWYYISQKSNRRLQFLGESVVDQRVTAVYFNKGLKVERVALYGLQDGKVFDFISRSTPAGGGDQNFVGQLFRGLTRFEPFSK